MKLQQQLVVVVAAEYLISLWMFAIPNFWS